jgi:hypothetical protein
MRDAAGTTLEMATDFAFAPTRRAAAADSFNVGIERTSFGFPPALATAANFTDVFPASITIIG